MPEGKDAGDDSECRNIKLLLKTDLNDALDKNNTSDYEFIELNISS